MYYRVVAQSLSLRRQGNRLLIFERGERPEGACRLCWTTDSNARGESEVTISAGWVEGLDEGTVELLVKAGRVFIGVLRCEGETAADDLRRGPARVLREATTNLQALRFLRGHGVTGAHRGLAVHYTASAVSMRTEPRALPMAADWRAYFDARRQLGSAASPDASGKLLHYERSRNPSFDAPRLAELVEELRATTGRYNYVPLSWDDVQELTAQGISIDGETFTAKVLEVEKLSMSCLMRFYRDGAAWNNYILVQGDLEPLRKTFFALFELCHLLRDLAQHSDVPLLGADEVHSVPVNRLPRDARSAAEMFALIGLFPTPAVAWEFRKEIASPRLCSHLFKDGDLLAHEAESRLLHVANGTLHPQMASPEAPWYKAMRHNLFRRLRSVIRRETEAMRGVTEVLPRRWLSIEEVTEYKRCLAAARWAHLDASGVLRDCSNAYGRFVGRRREEMRDAPVAELADDRTKPILEIAQQERASATQPVCYHFGFVQKNGLPVKVARLFCWPVRGPDGTFVGSFVIVGSHRTDWQTARDAAPVTTQAATAPVGSAFGGEAPGACSVTIRGERHSFRHPLDAQEWLIEHADLARREPPGTIRIVLDGPLPAGPERTRR